MYGIVNLAIEELIVLEHGEEVWHEIRDAADLHEPTFLFTEQYPDDVTFSLVTSASRVLRISTEAFLRRLGQHWVTFTESHGYGYLAKLGGDNFHNFWDHIDNIHARALAIMPNLAAPTIRFERLQTNELLIHYRSKRQGLAPMMLGIIEGAAKKFGETLELEHRERTADGADHDVFFARIVSSSSSDPENRTNLVSISGCDPS